MIEVPVLKKETNRLPQLYKISIFDSQPEEAFDEIVEVAARISNAAFAFIVLADDDLLLIKAKKGIGIPISTPNTICFAQLVLRNSFYQTENISKNPSQADQLFTVEFPQTQFFASVPLITTEHHNLGMLCVFDADSKILSSDQIFSLEILAKQIVRLFDIKLHNLEIEAQNAIVESQKLHLEELSKIQSKIISIVAHDVRSPVASLKKVLELKKVGAISLEKMDDFLAMVAKQMDGTIHLLTNLVDWGSILLNRSAAKFVKINLHDLVTTKLKNLEVASQVKHNQLINNIPKGYYVFSDENMLKFILRNLINNAIKFTEGGSISVTAQIELNLVTITVTDTGVGMNEDVKKSLFNPDRKSTRKGTHKEEGSGLGLILTREFAEILGSRIIVHSELGKGTSIGINLPLASE